MPSTQPSEILSPTPIPPLITKPCHQKITITKSVCGKLMNNNIPLKKIRKNLNKKYIKIKIIKIQIYCCKWRLK